MTVVDPALALALFVLGVLLLAVLLWPRRGLVAVVSRHFRLTDRVRTEDALKHLHAVSESGGGATVESLAGALGISRARAVRLAGRLEVSGLMRTTGAGLQLTDSGNEYALRIIRSHRLWERFLADRTGLHPAEWHEEAEHREHSLSPEQAERLSARMGHPRYDPHGDPIPTERLELPRPEGVTLAAMQAGQGGTIIHLEDEPRETYQRLIDAGLAPGMALVVSAVGPDGIRFCTEGRDLVLEPILAANVTVVPSHVPAAEAPEGSRHTLAEIPPGGLAIVTGISSVCQGRQRRRLLDLGIVPGTNIEAEFRSAAGDPIAYRIRGALIALRRNQARWILVEPVATPTPTPIPSVNAELHEGAA